MRLAGLLAFPVAAALAQPAADATAVPPVTREFRGVWVATVQNLDWPSRPGLPPAEARQQLTSLFDRFVTLGVNAVIFQVRPEGDALYRSELEPWSRYLTGVQGQAPDPEWDPLEFAVAEAHRRGLELHAWFNPYRAAYLRQQPTAANHVSRAWPDAVVPYGQFLWMNPALPEVRERALQVVADVVRRYDVDGVHIDDYFYPYPEIVQGRKAQFPDAASWEDYRSLGGELDIGDWRRANVNVLVRDLYATVKREKPWVKVGVSPFGIWRPANPPTIEAGVDSYDELFADARLWLNQGWLDYIAPQLYWPVRPAVQSYPVLLQWWVGESAMGRHVWPGLALYKLSMAGPRRMSADDIVEEIGITRGQPGAGGHVHFNASALVRNAQRISDRLTEAYREPALVPPSPWLGAGLPAAPALESDRDGGETLGLRFRPGSGESVARWVVQAYVNDAWVTELLPGAARTHILSGAAARATIVAVRAVDRSGNVGAAAVVEPR